MTEADAAELVDRFGRRGVRIVERESSVARGSFTMLAPELPWKKRNRMREQDDGEE